MVRTLFNWLYNYIRPTPWVTITLGLALLLSGCGDDGVLSFSESPIKFGKKIHHSVTEKTITLTNKGDKTVTFASMEFEKAGDFYFKGGSSPGVGGTCQTELKSKKSCTIVIVFQPTTSIALNLNLIVHYKNDSGAQQAALELSGQGAEKAALSFSIAGVLTFGEKAVDSSHYESVIVENTGGMDAQNISLHELPIPFLFSGGRYPGTGGTCKTVLEGGQTCILVLGFAPTVGGHFRGNVALKYFNGEDTTQSSLGLDGSADLPASLVLSNSPSYSLGNRPVNSPKDFQLTLSNTGKVVATQIVSSGLGAPIIFKGGTYPGTGGTCAATLSALSTCTIVITYSPTAIGVSSKTLSLAYNDGSTSQSTSRLLVGTAIPSWTWKNGNTLPNTAGIYGTQGTAAAANFPGAREGAGNWTDTSGNFWLMGGFGKDSAGNAGQLNDLWKYDGSQWTWVKGSNTRNSGGTYGVISVTAGTNLPGARSGSVSWTDSSGVFWLFGGYGYDSAGALGYLNDVWKFDGTDWTWVKGSNTINPTGVYGTQGTSAAANHPGGRHSATSWITSTDGMYLLGGYGWDSSSAGVGYLNDLWYFNGTDWTWKKGSNQISQLGSYGVINVTASGNTPGSRLGGTGWVDSSDYLYLFGGYGLDSIGTLDSMNDYWRFDGSDWVWMQGSSTARAQGVYGNVTEGASTNYPGARSYASSVYNTTDGILWLFGGDGYDSIGAQGFLNDIWKWDGTTWTWYAGSSTTNALAVYGSLSVASESNTPGARMRCATWIDSSGSFWLLGGQGLSESSGGALNDFWRF